MNILYLGARPKASLTQVLDKEGYTIVHARSRKAVLASLSTCAALVLHWRSKCDQRFIVQAQAAGVPVMVITASLVEAYSAPEPLADLYLEEPATDEDIVALLTDMIASAQSPSDRPTSGWEIGLAA